MTLANPYENMQIISLPASALCNLDPEMQRAIIDYVDPLLGQVKQEFSNTDVQAVGAATSAGTIDRLIRVDHVHRGVASVAKSGETALYGAVTLSAGAGVTLTQAANDISIASSGAKAYWIVFVGGMYGGMSQNTTYEASFLTAANYAYMSNPLPAGTVTKLRVYVTGCAIDAGSSVITIRKGAMSDLLADGAIGAWTNYGTTITVSTGVQAVNNDATDFALSADDVLGAKVVTNGSWHTTATGGAVPETVMIAMWYVET